jgi:6-pyruvoyltetrahydropterin/6-carboxytetrahydropterin synthase
MKAMEIFKEFSIEAAHWLPNVPEGHKCGRLHGHSFRIAIHVSGPLDAHLGWVLDFAEIKAAFKSIEDQIDHRCLNEVAGLENPTSENLARWLWKALLPALPALSRIVVQETCTSGCIYAGEPEKC